MIQIEALENIKSDGYIMCEGDRLTVEDDVARRWCGAGWAKAVKGDIETMPRRVVRSILSPDNGVITSRSEDVSNG